jgi:SAM-dependent methyltransferase
MAFGENALTAIDWQLFRFGFMTGVRTITAAPVESIKRIVLPVEYVRYVEFRYVLEHLDATEEHVTLDIGSPKLLSLFIASRIGGTVYATDLDPYFIEAYRSFSNRVLGIRKDCFHMEVQDACNLQYSDQSFDRVYSVSVIEHIPDSGDSDALKEIARVLKPGGICCLTLPWTDEGYSEVFKRKGDPDAYWASGEGDLVFYQRLYDRRTLESRVLEASADLEIIDLSFRGERRHAVEKMMSGRWRRYLMLPLHFPLSQLFLTELEEEEPSRKKIACITLRKRMD